MIYDENIKLMINKIFMKNTKLMIDDKICKNL
jgi:hypothetical protein